MDVSLTPRGDPPSVCVYCKDDIAKEDVVCPECGVRLHPECRREVSQCPTPGCAGRLPGVAARRPNRPAPSVPGGQFPPVGEPQRVLPYAAAFVAAIVLALIWSNSKDDPPKLHNPLPIPHAAAPKAGPDLEPLILLANAGDLEAGLRLAQALSTTPRLDPLEAWQTLAKLLKAKKLDGVTVLDRRLVLPLLSARNREFAPTLAVETNGLDPVGAALRCRLLAEATLGKPKRPEQRLEAAEALGRSAGELEPRWYVAAAAPLARAAVGQDAELRAVAEAALARFTLDGGEEAELASVRGYRDALHGGIADVRIRALKALAALGTKSRAARTEVAMLLELTTNHNVRDAARAALTAMH